MFAPEGYVSLREVISSAEFFLFSQVKHHFRDIDDSELQYESMLTPNDIVLEWVLNYFISDIFVSDLSDKTWKIDGRRIFNSEVNLYQLSESDKKYLTDTPDVGLVSEFNFSQLPEQDDVSKYNKSFLKIRSSTTDDERQRAIKQLKNIQQSVRVTTGQLHPKLFYNYHRGTVDLRLYQALETAAADDIYSQWRYGFPPLLAKEMQKIDGFHLIVEQSKVGKKWKKHCEKTTRELWKYRTQQMPISLQPLEPQPQNGGGRPNVSEIALAIMDEHFPNGNDGAGWKSIAAKVNELLPDNRSITHKHLASIYNKRRTDNSPTS